MASLDAIRRNLSFLLDTPLINPHTAMFNVVSRCNAKCQYCTDWKNDPDPKTDLSAERITKILSDLKSLGVKWVVFSGGEPLLRRDIFDLMESAKSLGLKFSLITNGTALTEAGVHKMAKLEISKIGVSIDTIDPTKATKIRGLPLPKVISSIDMLATLKNEQYPYLKVSLYVTITRLNITDLLSVANFAHAKQVEVQFQPVHFSGSGTPEQVLDHLWPSTEDIYKLESVVGELIRKKREGVAIGNREEFLMQIPRFFRDNTFYPGNRCTAAYTDITIDTDLGIRPCWAMEPVASLKHETIAEIWYSDKMKQARKTIRQKKCPGCLYACHLNKSYTTLSKL